MFRFSALARRLERRRDPASILARDLSGAATLDLASCEMLAALHRLLLTRDHVPLRDAHRLTGWEQPAALRAIRQLQQHGFVILGQELHDPLAAPITIPPVTNRRIARLLGNVR